jgi:nucleoside 2-deoxyribosyltransferase
MRDVYVAGKRQVRIFLSHSYADTVLAQKIRGVLSQHLGHSVFIHEDLSAGENWQVKLRKELEQADVIVALLTPQSVADSWLLQETGAAWALEKPIVPVVSRIEILDRFPIQLKSDPVLELKDLDTPENIDSFVRAFESNLTASHLS